MTTCPACTLGQRTQGTMLLPITIMLITMAMATMLLTAIAMTLQSLLTLLVQMDCARLLMCTCTTTTAATTSTSKARMQARHRRLQAPRGLTSSLLPALHCQRAVFPGHGRARCCVPSQPRSCTTCLMFRTL